MGSRGGNKQRSTPWSVQPLTPLMEGPDPEMQEEGIKKERSWDSFREWFRMNKVDSSNLSSTMPSRSLSDSSPPSRAQDLKLLLGVLGCPLAPIPLLSSGVHTDDVHHRRAVLNKETPLESSAAHYIIQQYVAATGILSKQEMMVKKGAPSTSKFNMYAAGDVKLVLCETEVSSGKAVKCLGGRSATENGCFVIWQMSPGMWSLELVVSGNKVVAGSDGKTVWRHTPWLGTHAAKGPQRPLRRIIQGLDPKKTAELFTNAQCLGERRVGKNDCFVLKVAAERSAVLERSDGAAEVLRHVLYGYFCQKSGLLVYLEDSHLTRVQGPDPERDAVYWETTIGSSIGDYREVDGVLIAHQGRSVATVFRFQEDSVQHSRTRMEEIWQIDDVVFNVQGLSLDHFIPPADIFDSSPSPM